MAKQLSAKALAKAQDKLIEKIYYANCSNMQINVMRIGALYAMARKMLTEGADNAAVGAAMVAFIQADVS
jgi:limonene-1,2-epoxide hydrolase